MVYSYSTAADSATFAVDFDSSVGFLRTASDRFRTVFDGNPVSLAIYSDSAADFGAFADSAVFADLVSVDSVVFVGSVAASARVLQAIHQT